VLLKEVKMEIKKINNSSSIGIGIVFAAFYFSLSLFQLAQFLISSGGDYSTITWETLLLNLIYVPLSGAVTGFVFSFLTIFIYNSLSRMYPISWEVSK
jgi:hypothetical protein